MKEQIILLRSQGKSYKEIATMLNCSKSLVCYYAGSGQKDNYIIRQKKRRASIHPVILKIERFNSKFLKSKKQLLNTKPVKKIIYDKLLRFNGGTATNMITYEQFMNKYTDNPRCYLSGVPIDLFKPSTYQLDHIVPVSRGGDNSIDNLGLASSRINVSKNDMTDKEFIEMCRNVVEYQDKIKSRDS